MKVNSPYSINKGDNIIPISEEPRVVIETDIKTGDTTATLLKGEAKIITLN